MDSVVVPGLVLLVLGTVTGALFMSGYFVLATALTGVGLAANVLLIKLDRKRKHFEEMLKDKPLY